MGLIKLKQWQWDDIWRLISKEYAHEPSMLLIRDKMRRELGFLPRHHKQWMDYTNETRGYYKEYVCIDFFTPSAESMFRIKYADILTKENKYGL